MNNENNFWKIVSKRMNQQPNLENFKNWDLVRQIPIYFHGIPTNFSVSISEPYENEVLEMLKKNKSHELRKWRLLLKEPMRGHTPESYKRALRNLSTLSEEATDCTEWTLKSAHHLLAFEDSTGQNLFEYDQIVEIGPGIGEVARMLLDAGFQAPYRILDLPEIYRISSYYLSDHPNVSFHNHFCTIPKTNKTLLIGTWSFSELEFELREKIISYFEEADFHFIYQNRFYEIDNRPFFQSYLPARLSNHRWIQRGIPLLPNDMYIFGISGSRNC